MDGLLNRYLTVLEKPIPLPRKKTELIPPKELPRLVLDSDAIQITVANTHPATSDLVELYTLSKFRRKEAVIVLVPDLKVRMDSLMFTRGDDACKQIIL